jgi:hypothetical protein
MATGGIFTIITNDGKQDRMLMATALLHDRLASIHQAKLAANRASDPKISSDDVRNLPTLLDIEKTHILFTNAHFKPFAAIGFEYNKVRPSSGTTALGSTIQFSIPQFGDFFHDIAFHAVLTQPTVTVTPGTAVSDQPAMRWANYPGERLLKKVTQEVNGNPLDEYTLHATVAHREYRVAPNKISAWNRCVGQEEAEEGFVRQANWALSGAVSESHRVAARVFTGNQTPSVQKSGSLELFVPLLFWYNKDVRLAVPSVAIPYGQRFINIELASRAELVDLVPRGAGTWSSPNGSMGDVALSTVELYINNIFMNPEVHKIYIKRIGFSLIRVHRQQLFTLNRSSDDLLLQQLKWPIEYLFVGAKVSANFNPSDPGTLRQTLDVWDKYSNYSSQSYTAGSSGERRSLLATTGSGTLGVTVGAAFATPVALTGTATLAQAVAAGDVLIIAGRRFEVAVGAAAGAAVTGVTVYNLGTAVVASAPIADAAVKVAAQATEYQTQRWAPTLDTINVSAHSIDIYKDFPAAFFNAYTPYHYGGPNINAPKDVGSLFIPFCLYPGTYQPSGHINVSRAREFYLKYSSSVISSGTPGLLVVIASAINFLLITDGSAVLRYST